MQLISCTNLTLPIMVTLSQLGIPFFPMKIVVSHVAAVCLFLIGIIPRCRLSLCANLTVPLDASGFGCVFVKATFNKFVSIAAMSFEEIQSAVLRVRNKLQMPRIDALSVSAYVMTFQWLRNRSAHHKIGSAISLATTYCFRVSPCVSFTVQTPKPVPATCGFIKRNALCKVIEWVCHNQNANLPTESEVCGVESQQSVSRLESVWNHLSDFNAARTVAICLVQRNNCFASGSPFAAGL